MKCRKVSCITREDETKVGPGLLRGMLALRTVMCIFRNAAKCCGVVKFIQHSVPLKSIVWGYGADLSAQRAAFIRRP